jgi:hypothetical protein
LMMVHKARQATGEIRFDQNNIECRELGRFLPAT